MLPLKKRIEKINRENSQVDFIKRLLDPDRALIQDWEIPTNVASHKMSVGNINNTWLAYPEIQNIDGELYDFTDPKNNREKFDAMDSAWDRGDYVVFPTKRAALRYTNNYKKYYPSFDKY